MDAVVCCAAVHVAVVVRGGGPEIEAGLGSAGHEQIAAGAMEARLKCILKGDCSSCLVELMGSVEGVLVRR